MNLDVSLRGEGVERLLTCWDPSNGGDGGGGGGVRMGVGGLLDFGYVLERESASRVIQVRRHTA